MQNYDYFFAFFWGLAVLGAFIGYGRLLSHLCGWEKKESLGWGIQAALGMAAVVAVGGWLLLCEVSTTPVMVALVIAGDAAAFFYFFRNDAKNLARFDRGAFLKDLPLWILAGVVYAASVTWPGNIDANDDLMCYFSLAERIAQVGNIAEPFNMRRTFALGGHVYLQAIVQSATSERTGHLIDMGISKLIIFGFFMQQTVRLREKSPILRFLLATFLLIFPIPRINTNSFLTGVCLIVPFLFLWYRFTLNRKKGLKSIFQLSLLLGATLTMRPTYLLLPLLGTIALFAWNLACRTKNFKEIFDGHLKMWFLTFILIIPWMTMSWITCKTPFYPIFNGNTNPNFCSFGSQEGFLMDFFTALSTLVRPEMVVFLIPLLSPFFVRTNAFIVLTSGCTFITFSYLVFKCGVAMQLDVMRVSLAIPIAVTLFLAIYLCNCLCEETYTDQELIEKSKAKQFLVLNIFCMFLVYFQPAFNLTSNSIASIYSQITSPSSFLPPEYKKEYRDLQGLTPPGTTILAAVDAPYLLNYKRNRIYNIDCIGGASPPPGIPFFQGPEKLKKYLKNLGVKYILSVDSDKAIGYLTRKNWTENKRTEWYWSEYWAPPALDFIDNINSLAISEGFIGRGPKCKLIELK